jgi:hypothetical protein
MSSDPFNDFLEGLTSGISLSQACLEAFETLPKPPHEHTGRRAEGKPRKYFTRLHDDRFCDGQYIGSCDRR